MRNTILFDLDGTLTDPAVGITDSVAYALSKFGITVEDRSELYPFIGPPLYDAFRERYGFSHDDANLAVSYYREYFAPKGIYENTVYNGIEEMLCRLKSSGKRLALATSKPERFANVILEHFGLDVYFDRVYGATFDETRNKKDDIIEYAIHDMGISPDDAVMVGDRKYDIEGGHKHGLLSVGVLYGYGDREELSEASADLLAENVKDLEKILVEI